ncbi:hypothetical protein AB1Y20_013760 [Prymnesium parvum]|uniref:Flagellar motor switch protein FliN-like C-terminal domain-containing protein n=1 Tax=Prymnesium parvum TaxID=97485 RepID=A0AB34IJ43_PRYPA
MQTALLLVNATQTALSKQSFGTEVLNQQFRSCSSRLLMFCAQTRWADVQPLKSHLVKLIADASYLKGTLRFDMKTARCLGALHQSCLAIQQTLADTLAACCSSLTTFVEHVWSQRKHVTLPSYLQPLSVRVKVIEVAKEVDRQRKTHAYANSIAHESVLLQYVIDTSLDRTLTQLFEVLSPKLLLLAQFCSVWRQLDSVELKAELNVPVMVDTASKVALVSPLDRINLRKYDQSEKPLNAAEANLDECIYGLYSSLFLIDPGQLLELRVSLGNELMPMGVSVEVEQHVCTVYTAFCGDLLLHGRFTSLKQLHNIQVRVDQV